MDLNLESDPYLRNPQLFASGPSLNTFDTKAGLDSDPPSFCYWKTITFFPLNLYGEAIYLLIIVYHGDLRG